MFFYEWYSAASDSLTLIHTPFSSTIYQPFSPTENYPQSTFHEYIPLYSSHY
jgi:hypothetical protein